MVDKEAKISRLEDIEKKIINNDNRRKSEATGCLATDTKILTSP